MNASMTSFMREATRLTHSGKLIEATAVIQRALGSGAGHGEAPAGAPGTAPEVASRAGIVMPRLARPAAVAGFGSQPASAPAPTSASRGAPDAASGGGSFTASSHTHAHQTRGYKLYVPAGASGRARPLVVMLHGCTQDPDDFAAGTGMNELGCEQEFFVLYPAQSRSANPSRCWNWFTQQHQHRDAGEPALLASMTAAVIEQHGIDPRRVYIAGLSAGGAMAAIVAAAYPDIFAAVGVHSGLPCGAAGDVSEALMMMKSGVPDAARASKGRRVGFASPPQARPPTVLPTIVFHGDQDRTVHPRNGEQVIARALDGAMPEGGPQAHEAAPPQVVHGVTGAGRRYTRSTHAGATGDTLAEHWLVHGAGHAWSGGDAKGSYTDGKGPDASREMLRFFLEHPMPVPH
jgi:poly(hydroxyalkanoate) depolymerase family esterase